METIMYACAKKYTSFSLNRCEQIDDVVCFHVQKNHVVGFSYLDRCDQIDDVVCLQVQKKD